MGTTIGRVEGLQSMNPQEVMIATWGQWNVAANLLNKQDLPTVLPLKLSRLKPRQVAMRFQLSTDQMETLRENGAMIVIMPLANDEWSVSITQMQDFDQGKNSTLAKRSYKALVTTIQFTQTAQFKGMLTSEEEQIMRETANALFLSLPPGMQSEIEGEGLGPNEVLTVIYPRNT